MKPTTFRNSLFICIIFMANVNAATIKFIQNNLTVPNGEFMAKGPGISGIDGIKYTDINGKTYTINNVTQGVQNTNLSIGAYANMDTKFVTPLVPAGSLGWSSQQRNSNYTFVFSAGGNPSQWDPRLSYCLNVKIDGKDIGTNCTDPKGYWSPTTVSFVPLNTDSMIEVTITRSN